jgi:hypothetical protein
MRGLTSARAGFARRGREVEWVLAKPRPRFCFSGSCAPQRSLRASIGVGVCVVRDATGGATSSQCVPSYRALSDASVLFGVACGARHCSCRDVAARRRRVSPGCGCDVCAFTFAREGVARARVRGCGRRGTGLALRCTSPCEVSGRPGAAQAARVCRECERGLSRVHCGIRARPLTSGALSSPELPSRSANKDMRQQRARSVGAC